MANGKFVMKRGEYPCAEFLEFDSDDPGAICHTARAAEDIGTALSVEDSRTFKMTDPGATTHRGAWKFFVEWRDA